MANTAHRYQALLEMPEHVPLNYLPTCSQNWDLQVQVAVLFKEQPFACAPEVFATVHNSVFMRMMIDVNHELLVFFLSSKHRLFYFYFQKQTFCNNIRDMILKDNINSK